jgi:hypothetical protein
MTSSVITTAPKVQGAPESSKPAGASPVANPAPQVDGAKKAASLYEKFQQQPPAFLMGVYPKEWNEVVSLLNF